MNKLTEWKRLYIETADMRKMIDENRIGQATDDDLFIMQKNFDFMDKIETFVKKYSFRITELYCLN